MLKMNRFSIEINSDSLRVVLARRNKVIRYGSKAIERGLVKDGHIVDPQTLAIIIDNVVSSMKVPRSGAICSLTGLPFMYRIITLPSSVTEKEVITEALTRAALKEMQLTPDNFFFTWQRIEALSDENYYLVVGVQKDTIQTLMQTMAKANIKLEYIELKPFSLARASACDNALLACLEQDYFDIVIIVDGKVRTIHGFSPHPMSRDNKDMVDNFIDELNKALRSYNSEFPHMPLPLEVPLLLSGDLSTNSDIVQMINDVTSHEVIILQPPLKHSIRHPFGDSASLYVNNIGCLLKKEPKLISVEKTVQYQDINLNLLEAFRGRKEPKMWPAYAATAAAFIFMITSAGIAYDAQVQKKSMADDLETQSMLITRQLAQQRSAYNMAIEVEERIKALNNSAEALRSEYQQIHDQRSDFTGYLLSINGALPDGVSFESISMDDNGISLKGIASSPFKILDFTAALERTDVFSEALILSIDPNISVSSNITDGVTFDLKITNSEK